MKLNGAAMIQNNTNVSGISHPLIYQLINSQLYL